MKGISLCADCAYYNMRTHKCKRGATGEPDLSKGDDVRFFTDCPLTDAEPVRHGRWIPTEYDGYADGAPVWDKWECSECGHEHKGEEDTLTAFCPDCGARMDATEDQGGGGDK